ncbi:MAG: glycosyl transferase family protein [Sphingobium sp.]
METAVVSLLSVAQHEILLFAAVGLVIGGVDDLLVDLLYLGRRYWRRLAVYSRFPRMTADGLPASPEPGPIAIFVPAWQEADVIAPMLRHALHAWGDADYRIFVGVYPNDADTVAQVAAVAARHSRIVMGINRRDGPTTKADCLNGLWQVMLAEEGRAAERFKAVVLHDAEDVVHPDELRVYDLLIDRFALVQLPVLPLPGSGSLIARSIADHYCDEFAESHGKALTVREAIGASIPSAGVACAFAREQLEQLAGTTGPFDPASLTEDYELGLRIADRGGRGAFVRIRDREGKLVATREYFPDDLNAAVRQKARWMIGISLAGWDRMGWHGGIAERWMRIRDRRTALAAIILCAAYIALLLWGILWLVGHIMPIDAVPIGPGMEWLLVTNGCLMLWRGTMRVAFTARSYGWRHGVGALPRMLLGNIITMLAARRAVMLYTRSLLGQPLTWDKTRHRFPGAGAG